MNDISLLKQALPYLRHHKKSTVVVKLGSTLVVDSNGRVRRSMLSARAAEVGELVRTGEPVPDLLTGLWRDDRVVRIDLEMLNRESVDTLLHLVLRAPMEVGAALHLWSVSRGNPLYLREVVLGAVDSGALVDRSGVWHLDGPVASSERLVDLVVEGDAHKVTDPSTVQSMAARWAAEGWPCRVDDSGVALTAEFSAPSAGRPPWFVYRITPRAATALGTVEPGGATRWSFADD